MSHRLYSLSIFMIFLGASFALIVPVVKADQSSSSASVTNALPVASSVSINAAAATVTLVESTTTTVTATFTVTDNNGCSDIDSHVTLDTKAVLYRSNVAGGAACSPDNASCYTMSCTQDASTCTAGGADLTATYTCTVPVQFYADATDAGSVNAATDWTATAIPRDNAGTDGTTGADTIEMGSLTALNVTAAIAYGALALGANTGTTDQTTVVTATGNRQIDIQVDGYGATPADGFALSCTIGTVAIGQERNAFSAALAWSSKIPITAVASTSNSFNLAQGASSTKNVYWGLGLPATGVGGTCSGIVEFTAVNG